MCDGLVESQGAIWELPASEEPGMLSRNAISKAHPRPDDYSKYRDKNVGVYVFNRALPAILTSTKALKSLS